MPVHSATLQGLPEEILLQIVDYLGEERADVEQLIAQEARASRQDLRSTSRTSRQLHRVSTTILYRRILLPTAQSVSLFLDTLRQQPSMATFIRQLSCPEPTAGLATLPYVFDSAASDYDAETALVQAETLIEILGQLPQIRALSLASRCFPGPVRALQYRTFSRLKSLQISVPIPLDADLSLEDNNERSVAFFVKDCLVTNRLPVLAVLEVMSSCGDWKAQLAPGPTDASGHTYKYVVSIVTSVTEGTGEWALMSLSFIPEHQLALLQRLVLAGPRLAPDNTILALPHADKANWDLSRFLTTPRKSLEILDLEWDSTLLDFPQLGPMRLQSLHLQPELRELTISLNMLFRSCLHLANEAQGVWLQLRDEQDFKRAVYQMLPKSLKILRLSEQLYPLHLLRASDTDPLLIPDEIEDSVIKTHNPAVSVLLHLLQIHWLEPGKELWFKRHVGVEYQSKLRNNVGRQVVNAIIESQEEADIGKSFARVLEKEIETGS